MGFNINSGYGQQVARQLAAAADGSFGKVHLVVDSSDVLYNDLGNIFGYDTKGIARFHSTIAAALAAADKGDVVVVKAKDMAVTSTDPVSFAEAVTISVPGLQLVGLPSLNRTQGGLPQIKKGSGSAALITVAAPGVTLRNLGINGASSTGGGVLIDDDGGSTKSAFGLSIVGCHFKNCVGSTATNAATGGAIQWSAAGNGWQLLIKGNRFYKNVGDVVLKGTNSSVPQDVVIEDNVFSGPAASVDCNLYLAGGSGINGVIIRNNDFPCFPAIGAGTNASPMVLTGCVGLLSSNRFGFSGKTFGAAANVLVPTTVLMANNYQEGGTTQITRT